MLLLSSRVLAWCRWSQCGARVPAGVAARRQSRRTIDEHFILRQVEQLLICRAPLLLFGALLGAGHPGWGGAAAVRPVAPGGSAAPPLERSDAGTRKGETRDDKNTITVHSIPSTIERAASFLSFSLTSRARRCRKLTSVQLLVVQATGVAA